MGEWLAAAVGVGVLAVHAVVIAGLWVWAGSVAARHPRGFFAVAGWLPAAGALLLCAGYGVTGFFLIRNFGLVANADASSKATLLAKGISESMNSGALLAALGMLVLGLSAACSLVGTLKGSPSAPEE